MPGRNFSNEQPRYVIPDVMVKLQEGEFAILLNDEDIPVLTVNPFYTRLSEGKAKTKEKEVKKFVSDGVQDARWFIRSIRQRNQTLLKICKAIVEFQREFFRKGPKYLVPLTLKDIAAEDRGSRGHGVPGDQRRSTFRPNGASSSSSTSSRTRSPAPAPAAARFSKGGVKEMIREIVEGRAEGTALTDQKIGELLAEKGVKIARRTIAKYRKELDIMSSHHR